MAIDLLADRLGVSISTNKFNALIAQTRTQAVSFYKIEPQDILVLHDDMDLPVGSVRIRKKGSAGGQKGMKSIISCLKTDEIARIRIGVGHSQKGNHEIVPDWVLSPVSMADREVFDTALKAAAEAAYAWVSEDMDKVMSRYNIKVKEEKETKETKQEE